MSTFMDCFGEGKLVQPFRKRHLAKYTVTLRSVHILWLSNFLSNNLCWEIIYIYINNYKQNGFISVLFVIPKKELETAWVPIIEGIMLNKLWYIESVEYYIGIKMFSSNIVG